MRRRVRSLRAVWALLLACVVAIPARGGEMRQVVLESQVLHRPWNLAVYLPDGFAGGVKRYPMLFFFPGFGATSRDVAQLDMASAADAAISDGRMPPSVIVVPELGLSWGLDAQERMQTALAEELVPEATRRWRGMGGRSFQAVGGISAGGYAALRLAMLYPDRFSAAVLLSPAVYVPQPPARSGARVAAAFGAPSFRPEAWSEHNYPALLPGLIASGYKLRLFIATGAEDHLGIADHAARLQATWREAGLPARLVVVPGGHEPAVWRGLLPQALAFAFRDSARPIAVR